MTELQFLAYVVVPYLTLMALLWCLARRRHHLHNDVHEQTPSGSAMRNAIEHWLATERIFRVMLDTKTATALALENTRTLVPSMSEAQLRSTCEMLLRHKTVRRVIAMDLMNRHPEMTRDDHATFLRQLTQWANPVPERRSA